MIAITSASLEILLASTPIKRIRNFFSDGMVVTNNFSFANRKVSTAVGDRLGQTIVRASNIRLYLIVCVLPRIKTESQYKVVNIDLKGNEAIFIW